MLRASLKHEGINVIFILNLIVKNQNNLLVITDSCSSRIFKTCIKLPSISVGLTVFVRGGGGGVYKLPYLTAETLVLHI